MDLRIAMHMGVPASHVMLPAAQGNAGNLRGTWAGDVVRDSCHHKEGWHFLWDGLVALSVRGFVYWGLQYAPRDVPLAAIAEFPCLQHAA